MKFVFRTAAAVLLAMVLFIQAPTRAYAEAQNTNTPDYISEVKIAMGSDAESALKGYTILSDENGKAVDLNQGAGGSWGSQGDKKVILGYKTTKNQSEAITDLAVMNMKGGYSVQEYEALIQQRLDAQIIPLVQKIQTTINEYRENLNSSDDVNRARAEYVRAALNKFTDDDCGGAKLGDLLLNPTKFEMGDAAYNALSEDQKKQHCDIVTLFMQADGQMMLMVLVLLTRAADTGEEGWVNRFSMITYDDLIASYDMPETDAKIQAAKDFEDDARILLKNWDAFRAYLMDADEAAETVDQMTEMDLSEVENKVDKAIDSQNGVDCLDALSDLLSAELEQTELIRAAEKMAVADYLESIDYEDGTLYDFFMKSSSEFEGDLSELYPLIASLSEGQRAGLEFISLSELVISGNRDSEYDPDQINGLPETSVFEGVDRAIYEKGGVALTSDALRAQALEAEQNLADRSLLSTKTIVLYALTGASALGFAGSVFLWGVRSRELKDAQKTLKDLQDNLDVLDNKHAGLSEQVKEEGLDLDEELIEVNDQTDEVERKIWDQNEVVGNCAASTRTAAWMSVGFAAAMVVLAGVSVYLTWEDMKAYYKVDFSPIPHYMVDETAITYYNQNGEKLVKENHAAYYKAVTCANRTDKKYIDVLGDCADLNGDVGQQWVALYACWDNKACQPILADSLKAVVGKSEVPAGYESGIHMFGSDAAFNMNNKLYDWNQSAKSVYVYFQIDTEAPVSPSTAGSAFTGGWIALTAILGVALGSVLTAVSMTAIRKKKERIA